MNTGLELSDLCDQTVEIVSSLRSSVLFPTETSVVLDRFWRLQDQTYRLVAFVSDNAVEGSERRTRVRAVLRSIIEVLSAAEGIPLRKLAAVTRASASINKSLRILEQMVAA